MIFHGQQRDAFMLAARLLATATPEELEAWETVA